MGTPQTAQYESSTVKHKRSVMFRGTTALKQGQGVCFKRDYTSSATGEAATDATDYRDTYVELPDGTNNNWFAGVCIQDYPAHTSGVRRIEIYEPGSTCLVAIGVDTTLVSGIITCSAGAGDPGRFGTGGLPGRGSAIPLQTTTAGIVFSELTTVGTLSAAGNVITAGAGTPNSTVVVGDTVYVVSRLTTDVTLGAYTVSAVSATTITVSTDITVGTGGTDKINYYVTHGNATCLAHLMDGQESGLQEIISPIGNGAAQSMVGGATFIGGPYTVATADSTSTLADGTMIGELKYFKLLEALTTNDWLLTVTSGEQLDGTTDLASLEFDGAADTSLLVWGGPSGKWRLLSNTGTAAA
jgi:hypothetical protein